MTTIKDKLFGPYEIQVEEHQFILMKKEPRVDKLGNQIYTQHGYYGSFESCVKHLIRMRVADENTIMTLETYLKELRSFKKAVREIIYEN